MRAWILAPAETTGNARTRALLLSTAAALLSLSITEAPPRRSESPLFTTPLTPAQARTEWVQETGLAPVSRVKFTVFGNVRGEDPETLMGDLGPGTLLVRARAMLASSRLAGKTPIASIAMPQTPQVPQISQQIR